MAKCRNDPLERIQESDVRTVTVAQVVNPDGRIYEVHELGLSRGPSSLIVIVGIDQV